MKKTTRLTDEAHAMILDTLLEARSMALHNLHCYSVGYSSIPKKGMEEQHQKEVERVERLNEAILDFTSI